MVRIIVFWQPLESRTVSSRAHLRILTGRQTNHTSFPPLSTTQHEAIEPLLLVQPQLHWPRCLRSSPNRLNQQPSAILRPCSCLSQPTLATAHAPVSLCQRQAISGARNLEHSASSRGHWHLSSPARPRVLRRWSRCGRPQH